MNSKAQAWFADFAIALVLFTFTLVIYFSYTTNFQKEEKGELDLMLADAKSISSSLTLSGYPNDWDNTTVIRIGISDDQKINAAKLVTFKQLNYNITRNKFATVYDYFVFFTDNIGNVLNIQGICGVGNNLVTTSYNIKSAYYYSDNNEDFLKDFMNNTFSADIYFGDNPSDQNDIDALISSISKYGFLVFENPNISSSNFNNFKTKMENFSSSGGLTIMSGQLSSSQGQNLVGVDFYNKSGQSESDRNSTVNNTDKYLALNIGDSIVFRQAYYIENTSNAVGFKQIATFNADQRNSLSKWKFGNGTIYFFSDFDTSYFSGDFIKVIEDLGRAMIEGTCNPINITQGQKKLIKTERYLIYNSKVVKMVVYVWQ